MIITPDFITKHTKSLYLELPESIAKINEDVINHLLIIIKEQKEALSKVEHCLVYTQGCFASDLIWSDRLPHLENGTQVEWQIDDSQELELIKKNNSTLRPVY